MNNEISLEDSQKIALSVLERFHSICEENGFKYFLAYGTLIGAIRHEGFIPWDDDIDVMMPRKDFDRFVVFCKENEKNLYPLRLHNRENTQYYWYGIPRLSDMRYKYVVDNTYEKPFDIGVFIDIYPLDNYGDSYDEAKRLFDKCFYMNRQYDWYVNPTSQGSTLRSIPKTILHYYMRITRGKLYSQEIDYRIRDYILSNTNENNRFLGMVCFAGKIVLYERSIVKNIELIKHNFSGKQFYIPKEYDYMLKQSFGDYMVFPPEEERHPTHHYKIYIR